MGYSDLVFDKNSVFLVTGGAGFIGSNLCETILNMGYNVRCLDNLSTGKKDNIEHLLDNPNFEFIEGDIRDFDTCLTATTGVDFVLHVVCNSLFLHNDINKFKKLKFIQATSAGLDRLPLDYINKNNIVLKNASGVYNIPIAEWVITKILDIYKKTNVFYEQQKNKIWR